MKEYNLIYKRLVSKTDTSKKNIGTKIIFTKKFIEVKKATYHKIILMAACHLVKILPEWDLTEWKFNQM